MRRTLAQCVNGGIPVDNFRRNHAHPAAEVPGMFNTSVTLAHVVFTVSFATLATGCAVNGKSLLGSTGPSPLSSQPSQSSPVVAEPGSASSSDAPAAGAEPDLERFKFDLIRAEAGLNESTSQTCLASYNALLAQGVSPSHRMRFRDEEGTIESMKQKYCVDAAANHAQAEEQRAAPFRAVLKADKLKMAIKSHYAVAGGDYSMDPAKLAAAPVWFDSVGAPSNEKQHCDSGGKRNVVRRYQFDASHVLVKTSSQEYCGEPPTAAYR